MSAWPSLRRVVTVWMALTACACFIYVAYLRSLPPDELLMANTLSFQVISALLMVGLPSLACLFLFLFVGSMLKRRGGL
jgi:hypothetical protein